MESGPSWLGGRWFQGPQLPWLISSYVGSHEAERVPPGDSVLPTRPYPTKISQPLKQHDVRDHLTKCTGLWGACHIQSIRTFLFELLYPTVLLCFCLRLSHDIFFNSIFIFFGPIHCSGVGCILSTHLWTFCFSFCWCCLGSSHCGWKRLDMGSVFLNFLHLYCDSAHDLPWRILFAWEQCALCCWLPSLLFLIHFLSGWLIMLLKMIDWNLLLFLYAIYLSL